MTKVRVKGLFFVRLNASILRGEFVVLLGRSGSGKSTLLNLISGIDLPTEGEVLIGGQNLTTMTEQKRTLFRRDNIGFVFQFYNLIPTLTVIENLLLPLELKKNIEAGSKKHALQILEQVSLADRANSYPTTFPRRATTYRHLSSIDPQAVIVVSRRTNWQP